MSDNGLPSVAIQDSVIDAYYNSSLLNLVLIGLYTTVYVGTVHIYFTSKASHSVLVLMAISILYFVNLGQASIAWYLVKQLLTVIGEPRDDIFIMAATGPSWIILVSDTFTALLSVVADGLLIWRSYNVWDGSLRKMLPSLILLLGETALYLSAIIMFCQQHLNPDPNTVTILNNLFGAALFISFGTTFLTTSLIAYRIFSVSRNSTAGPRNNRPFRHILALLAESAAAYAITSFIIAVQSVIPFNPTTPTTPWTLYVVQNYMNVIFSITAGMAPTIMVARIALASAAQPRQLRSAQISDLEFIGGISTAQDMTQAVSSGEDANFGLSDKKLGV